MNTSFKKGSSLVCKSFKFQKKRIFKERIMAFCFRLGGLRPKFSLLSDSYVDTKSLFNAVDCVSRVFIRN